MVAPGSVKRPKMGRRRLVVVGISVGMILVGLFVLTYQSWVASQLQPYIGSALGSAEAATQGLTPYGSLSYLVYAIGIGLIASGGAFLRTAFRSSMYSYMSGGSTGAMGMDPEALQGMMSASMARAGMASTAPTTEKTAVKVKCRNCGSLEDEDATYCRKCGQAM